MLICDRCGSTQNNERFGMMIHDMKLEPDRIFGGIEPVSVDLCGRCRLLLWETIKQFVEPLPKGVPNG